MANTAGVRRQRPSSTPSQVSPDPTSSEPGLVMSFLRFLGSTLQPAAKPAPEDSPRRSLRAYCAPLDLPDMTQSASDAALLMRARPRSASASMGSRLARLRRALLRQSAPPAEAPEVAQLFASLAQQQQRAARAQEQLESARAQAGQLLQAVTDLESDCAPRCPQERALARANAALREAVDVALRVRRFTDAHAAADDAMQHRDMLRLYRRTWERFEQRERKAEAAAARGARPASLSPQQRQRQRERETAQQAYDAVLRDVCARAEKLLQTSVDAAPVVDELMAAQSPVLLALRALARSPVAGAAPARAAAGAQHQEEEEEEEEDELDEAERELRDNDVRVRKQADAVYRRFWPAFSRALSAGSPAK